MEPGSRHNNDVSAPLATGGNYHLPDVIEMADFANNSNNNDRTGSRSQELEADDVESTTTFDSSDCWKYTKFLAPRVLIVAAILGAFLAPFLVLGNSMSSSYVQVYHYPMSNHTVIIHGIRLSQNEGQDFGGGSSSSSSDPLQGVSKYFVSTTLKSGGVEEDEVSTRSRRDLAAYPTSSGSGNFYPPLPLPKAEFHDPLSGYVVVIDRRNWEQRKIQVRVSTPHARTTYSSTPFLKANFQILSSEASAVLVLDSETFRPSSPHPEILSDEDLAVKSQSISRELIHGPSSNIPVYLIRKEDSAWIPQSDGKQIAFDFVNMYET